MPSTIYLALGHSRSLKKNPTTRKIVLSVSIICCSCFQPNMRRRSLKNKTIIHGLFPLHAFFSLIIPFSSKKAINNIGKKLVSTLLAKANVATQNDGRDIGYMKNTKPLQRDNFISNK